MAIYVAFLRGMNLGNRRIKNDELRGEFEQLGLDGVTTFRASGNVVFESAEGSEAALTETIETGLAAGLGYDVPVFLRSAAEVAAVAAHEPFDSQLVAASKGKLQVSLLLSKPAATARKKVLALATDDDLLAIRGRELYWLPSGGTLESSLDQKEIAAGLGTSTTRTMGTIEQIAAKYCG